MTKERGLKRKGEKEKCNNRIFVNVFITENDEIRQGEGEKERQREILKKRKIYFLGESLRKAKRERRRQRERRENREGAIEKTTERATKEKGVNNGGGQREIAERRKGDEREAKKDEK